MTIAEIIDNLIHPQAGSLNHLEQVIAVEHLAVAVGHGGKIHTRLREVEGRSIELLPVPERLHNIYTGARLKPGSDT